MIRRVVMVLLLSACARPTALSGVDDDEPIVSTLAAGGAELDEQGPRGMSALLLAAERGQVESVIDLLAHGADPSSRDASGLTALHVAVRASQRGTTLALLDAKADPNVLGGPRGERPLHYAAMVGDVELMRLLLDRGAEVNAVDSWRQSALHRVCRSDTARTAAAFDVLVARGADLHQRDVRGFTALHFAAQFDNFVFVRKWNDVAQDLSSPSLTDETPLDVALAYRADLAAQALFELGAATKIRAGVLPPLHAAARDDDVAKLYRLLGAGARRDGKFDGVSALDVARQSGSSRVIHALGG